MNRNYQTSLLHPVMKNYFSFSRIFYGAHQWSICQVWCTLEKKIEFYEDEIWRIYTLCFGLLKKFISLDLFLRDFNAARQQQQFRDFLWSMTRHTFWTQWSWRAAMLVKKIQIWSRGPGKVSAFIVCRFRLRIYRNAASSPHNQPWHYRAYGSSIQGHSSILMCDRAASLASLENHLPEILLILPFGTLLFKLCSSSSSKSPVYTDTSFT